MGAENQSLERGSPFYELRQKSLRLLVDHLDDYSIIILDPEGRVVTWTAGAQRLHGYSAAAIVGKHHSVFYCPEDVETLKPQHHLERARDGGRFEAEGLRVRQDRTSFWASVLLIALRDERGQLAGFGKVTRDLSARRKAEEQALHLAEERVARTGAETARAELEAISRRTMQLQDVTAAFAEALSPEQVRSVIFGRVLRAMNADSGCLAAVEHEGHPPVLLWSSADGDGTQEPKGRLVFPSDHPQSHAARTRTPVFLESLEAIATAFPGQPSAFPGAQALAAIPLIIGQRCIGVLSAAWRTRRTFTLEDRRLALALTQQCAQAIERVRAFEEERRARERAEAAERRLTLLAEASRLLSSSLDYEATLKRLSDLTVPWLADWCSIELVDEAGIVERRTISHVDPRRVELAHELFRRHPRKPGSDRGLSHVLRTGVAELWPDVSDELLVSYATHADQLSTWRQLGFGSVIMAPLVAGSRIIGAMTLIGAESGRRFTQADLQLAQEVANRAALAIDNANLYRQAQQAIQRRDEFLSVASHELRTPVTALELLIGTLLRSLDAGAGVPFEPEKLQERLLRARKQTHRLTTLLSQLLDVGRLSESRLTLELESVELMQLVTEVVSRFEDLSARTGTPIHLTPCQPVVGSWDRSRIDQVIANLVSNALKYGVGKPVEIRVEQVGPVARVIVRDQGIGIAKEDQDRIFERFERAASRNFGGIGIGLWITRQILDLHGGRVAVESAFGQGSTFIAELPLQRGRAEGSATDAA
jgi:PAS domain S-box-containing protein